MFGDAFDRSQNAAEVTIIGAGPVGLAIALELDRLGISSQVLEAGGLRRRRSVDGLFTAQLRTPATHGPLEAVSAKMFGGTSNLWAGACVAYDPIDFKERKFVSDGVWPITYEDVSPFLEPASRFLDAGPAEFIAANVAHESGDEFSCTSLARFACERRSQVRHGGAAVRSARIRVCLNTVVTEVFLSGDGVVTGLAVASSDGSKLSRLPVRMLVVAAGGIETTRLALNMQRDRPRLFGGEAGPLGRYYMSHLMGSIADVRFLKPQHVDLFDFRKDANGTYTRRRFQPSEATQKKWALSNTVLWPEGAIADARHQRALLSLVFLLSGANGLGRAILPEVIRRRYSENSLGSTAGAHLRNLAPAGFKSILADANSLLERWYADPRPPGFLIRNQGSQYRLAYHAEHLPNRESRVTLTGEVDRLGMNRIAIDLRFTEADAASLERTHQRMSEWLKRGSLARMVLRCNPSDQQKTILRQAKDGTHQLGMTRMASSAKDGVVDRDLRAFGIANLYLCSTSVLPTSSQANPTLIVVALALRLSHHLAHAFKAEERPASLGMHSLRSVRSLPSGK
ncbi:GMC oxidoreductase [Bradyrhizobium arachidis]|uniref:Glucose-methanol-choline oxidoreductase C-terminal domain-containing protein n=1 Tax=Bradyrhizobium arachidis TaxID=858423 RepID=A0AAE7NQV1_9BRAD|nr:GMC oxidoreductase [Bradyrhizobium arachidis]QOZ67863.1 hypothetical protein WN72_17280 [Bradyrhizobium arachidis]SFV10436.1 GMC oxidoreductase [Bradyrhizobium arachidis]